RYFSSLLRGSAGIGMQKTDNWSGGSSSHLAVRRQQAKLGQGLEIGFDVGHHAVDLYREVMIEARSVLRNLDAFRSLEDLEQRITFNVVALPSEDANEGVNSPPTRQELFGLFGRDEYLWHTEE
ncbi:hypothetical protein, partial [Cupriavidus sp. HMR-1]|uniref:hypothetical protein n=1 Tax=Cupriavidus sp. HMR-1 TaxID=1249621 RepID=UPI0019D3B530